MHPIIEKIRSDTILEPGKRLPLADSLAESLKDGRFSGMKACKDLMRAAFIADEAEIYKEIAGGDRKIKIGTIFEALDRLERVFLKAPPLSDPRLYQVMLLAALFASEDGAVSISASLKTVAKKMLLSEEITNFLSLVPGAILEAQRLSRPNDLAHFLTRLCTGYVSSARIRDVEIPDLAFSLVSYLQSFYGLQPSCSEKLSGYVSRYVGYEWKEYERAHTASMINRVDLRDLGILYSSEAEKQCHQLLNGLSDLKLARGLGHRSGTLRVCKSLYRKQHPISSNEGVELSPLEPFLGRTGSNLSQFHPLKELSSTRRGDSEIKFFELEGASRRQFRSLGADIAVFEELFKTENYPEIRRHFAKIGLCESTVVDLVCEGRIRSLVELTYLCREFEWKQDNVEGFSLGIDNIRDLNGVQLSYARVNRVRNPISAILLAVGYHGKAEKTGYGERHISEGRGEELRKLEKLLSCSGEQKELVRRFIIDGVLHVAATSNVILPSGHRPRTHSLLIGTPLDNENAFVTIVLSKLPDYEDEDASVRTIVTAMVHTAPGQIRAYIRGQLRQFFEKSRDEKSVIEALATSEDLLARAGAAAITLADVFATSASMRVDTPTFAEPEFESVLLPTSSARELTKHRKVLVASRESRGYMKLRTHAAVATMSGPISEIPKIGIGCSSEHDEWNNLGHKLIWSPVFATELLKDKC